MRESYRLRVHQTREEEELIRQQAARREAGIEGRRWGTLKTLSSFANFVQLLFSEIRGRLRKALAGLGEGEFVVEDHREDQSPLLKETECPVCLQVDHDGAGWCWS